MSIRLEVRYANGLLPPAAFASMAERVALAHRILHEKSGAGAAFLGWLDLPGATDPKELARIEAAALRIRQTSDVLLVVGIGGSYLGARAALELLRSPYYNNLKKETPDIYFVGNSLSAGALSDILHLCEGRRVSVNVVSKSGTTTEPAVAFRIVMDYLTARYGEKAVERVYCTTDPAGGSLRTMASENGYETFCIPPDIGGRYSVLTAVGLLPMAVAGINLSEVLRGAADAMRELSDPDFSLNHCYRYAVSRRLLEKTGRRIELFVSYQPSFTMMGEWLKQLFGESEGKEGKGIFPAFAGFTADLHSMGQFIQEGSPLLFETVVDLGAPRRDIAIPPGDERDGLGFLQGHGIEEVNRQAMEATLLAHADGNVPCLVLSTPRMDCHGFGYLVYFFEKACAMSAYLLDVNPFDQPGVESYKKNMYALLGKPGYEELGRELRAKLNA